MPVEVVPHATICRWGMARKMPSLTGGACGMMVASAPPEVGSHW